MSFYLNILAVQRPFDISVSTDSRTQFSCNYTANARGPVDDWELEIAALIVAAGLGVIIPTGQTMWVGRNARIPVADGPYIQLLNTGGAAPTDTHDDASYEALAIQVLVIGRFFGATRQSALDIWRVLHNQHNVTLAATPLV